MSSSSTARTTSNSLLRLQADMCLRALQACLADSSGLRQHRLQPATPPIAFVCCFVGPRSQVSGNVMSEVYKLSCAFTDEAEIVGQPASATRLLSSRLVTSRAPPCSQVKCLPRHSQPSPALLRRYSSGCCLRTRAARSMSLEMLLCIPACPSGGRSGCTKGRQPPFCCRGELRGGRQAELRAAMGQNEPPVDVVAC